MNSSCLIFSETHYPGVMHCIKIVEVPARNDLCILDNNRLFFYANLMPYFEKEVRILYAFQVIVDLHCPLNGTIVIFCASI